MNGGAIIGISAGPCEINFAVVDTGAMAIRGRFGTIKAQGIAKGLLDRREPTGVLPPKIDRFDVVAAAILWPYHQKITDRRISDVNVGEVVRECRRERLPFTVIEIETIVYWLGIPWIGRERSDDVGLREWINDHIVDLSADKRRFTIQHIVAALAAMTLAKQCQ